MSTSHRATGMGAPVNIGAEAEAKLGALRGDSRMALASLTALAAAADRARDTLFHAELAATNRAAAEPDDPAADRWCDWCGECDPARLEDDGGGPGCPPEWRCADLARCLARRRRRYPDAQPAGLAGARQQAAYLSALCRAGAIALTAWMGPRSTSSPIVACARSRSPARCRSLSPERSQACRPSASWERPDRSRSSGLPR